MNKLVPILVTFVAAASLLSCVTSDVVETESVLKVEVPLEDRIVISVARFDDRSVGTEEFRPWELGIPDTVMEALGALPYYRVISREYMMEKVLAEQEFQLAGVTDTTAAVRIGQLLNAEYILIGSFQVFRGALQIQAKVLSVATGEIKAQANSDGPLGSFFAIQNEIAIRITESFSLDLPGDAKEKLRDRVDTTVVRASLANYRGEDNIERMQLLEGQNKGKEAAALRDKAKADFEEALSLDGAYQKAKDNLAGLTLAIPRTL